MSDDEEYYDDDFDADWIWFDDGERELVDDLAEGTMHSPVFMDQGVYDAIDSASDWDYYTDEYFDDDLSVMRKQRLADAISPKGTAEKKMRNKRKQGEQQRDGNDNTNNKDNPSSFCRILWRSSGYLVDQGELYEPGKGEKVALLKNWREIFKDSQPKRDHRLQKSVSSSHITPQSPFSKSAASRKQPGRPRKSEKRNVGVKIGRIIGVPIFDSEGGSEEGSEETEGREGWGRGSGGDGDGGEYFTPPPSYLSASQQEIYEKSRKKAAGPSRGDNNGKNHNMRSGSHLKSVMSAAAQEEVSEPAPIMTSPLSASTTSSKRRSGRLSTPPPPSPPTHNPQSQSYNMGKPGNLALRYKMATKLTLPIIFRRPRTDGAIRSPHIVKGGNNKNNNNDNGSKRAATRRKLRDDDHDDKDNDKSKIQTKVLPPATITATTRRSLRERKK